MRTRLHPTFGEGWRPTDLVSTAPWAGAGHRPDVIIADDEHRELCRLAIYARSARPLISELLVEELGRARVVPADRLPPNVVRMNATIEYRHDILGCVGQVKLVYPPDADIDARRVSILTSIGAGLIGLAEGASMTFSVRPGSRMGLTVLKVVPPDPTPSR